MLLFTSFDILVIIASDCRSLYSLSCPLLLSLCSLPLYPLISPVTSPIINLTYTDHTHTRTRTLTHAHSGVQVTITPNAEDWLARSGFNPQFGARPLKRLIQGKLLDPLATMILEVRIVLYCTVLYCTLVFSLTSHFFLLY